MTSWLLILFIGTNPNGTPQFIVKPFDSERECMQKGGQIDVLERLNDNYGVWWTCHERIK